MKIVKWQISPISNKKYRVYLDNGRHVDFGSKSYQQYRDTSPLKAYSHLDHLDKARRDRYYARHKKDYPPYSADWLSKRFLWT